MSAKDTAVNESIAAALGSGIRGTRPVGGGSIHHARWLVLADDRRVFVKAGGGEAVALLEAEACGLELLAPHIRVPQLLARGTVADEYWLAMEWLDLRPLDARSWESLGRALANLHRVTRPEFGLDHDNFIGATPQENAPLSSWCEFFIERRLKPQLRLARAHSLPERDILKRAEHLLEDHRPQASLLHGDLWIGNAAGLRDGSAVVFDPAPYYGDAETDLAMLQLFGGPLPPAFFEGYQALDVRGGRTDYDRSCRWSLYNLYHALNHLNLFGTGYLPMVHDCWERAT